MPKMRASLVSTLLAICLPVLASEVPQTPSDAVAALQTLWKDSLSKQLENSPYIKILSQQIVEPGRVYAQLQPAADSLSGVSNSLSETEKAKLILFGRLDDLKIDRKVWAIRNPGTLGSGFEAYVDSKDGRLLLLWIIPEG
jgi:hypothetical protein